ncbi:MAG: hypothetical protein AAF721_27615, partial [Myxococcota bacterium]
RQREERERDLGPHKKTEDLEGENLFSANITAARGDEVSWYCALLAGGAAGLLFAAAALGCGALLAGCTAAGTITFGGITFLCAPLITSCSSGALATLPACYLYITIYVWGGD